MGINDKERSERQAAWKTSTMRFLISSFVAIIIVCIGVLAFFAVSTSKKSEKTINKIGTIYMAGMNERIAMHFEATVESRLNRVEYLIDSVPAADQDDYDEMKEKLVYGAEARNLSHLAFLAEDGTLEMLLGDQIELADADPFLGSLNEGEEKIAAGLCEQYGDIMALGVPAEYPMKNGKKCVALVGAMPVDYIKKLLALDDNYSLVYSHIIRRDGSFVIKNGDVQENNYFELMTEYFLDSHGKVSDTYVQELKKAMSEKSDYSALFYMENDRRHLYCTALPYSEWYLITVMPYGSLDEAVNELNLQRFVLLLISIGVILCVLLIVFVKYFRLTQRQICELEETRTEAVNANRAKSEFLSNMSHDIRTPMNAILGMTAIAVANVENTDRVRDCLKKITLSGKHLLGLINDILDMSKIESGKLVLSMEQISLPEIMDGVVNIIQAQIKEKQQQFDIFIHDIAVENVYCDSVRLNQILINLLSNAIKFTPQGGLIHVSLNEEDSPAGEDYVRVHFRVKDSGIGMAPEFVDKIFETFTREDNKRVHKTEGTGLGMAITKYIVDAMGGSIEVESQVGKGSEFHVILDLEKAVIPEADMILPDWNMLLVDDDEELCVSARSSLESIGIKSDWALDGYTAIKMVEDRHRKHDDYQIILIDWKMPGINGIETARIIRREMGESVPILLISAYDWSSIEEEAREAGVTGFISKPLFKSTLFYGLKQYTDDKIQVAEHSGNSREDFGGARVLVAEDNELNWEIAKELLSQYGLELEWAENGQICVDKYTSSPVGYYSAILMDIRMPVMTGYEATEAIRSQKREDSDVPIIAMTADAFTEDVENSLRCGMNAHVAKPIDVKEVTRLLEKFIG